MMMRAAVMDADPFASYNRGELGVKALVGAGDVCRCWGVLWCVVKYVMSSGVGNK